MSDQIKHLNEEIEVLAGKMLALNEEHRDGMSTDVAEKWDAICADHTAKELLRDRVIKMKPIQAAQNMGIDIPNDYADHGMTNQQIETVQNTDADSMTRDQKDYAMRGWCLGAKRSTNQWAGLAATAGHNMNISEMDLRSTTRGVDKDGNEIRMQMLPPMTQDGWYRPRTARDIVDLYEQRQIGLGTPAGGPGSNTVPDELMTALEVALLAFGGMRAMSTIISTSTGANLPIPTIDDTTNKGRILAEAGDSSTGGNNEMEFGQTNLSAFKYTSDLIQVSIEFMQDTSIDAFGVIGSLLGVRIGRIHNQHFTTGVGGGTEPAGIIDATLGTTASGVVQATLGIVTWEQMVDLMHSVDPEYANAPGAAFMFNWTTLAQVKQIKDSQTRPLWLPSTRDDAPPTLLGKPYVINQDMPDVDTVNLKSILFGDQTKYWVRDTLGVTLLVLRERYAELGQIAFVAFNRADGRLIRGRTTAADANTAAHPLKHWVNAAA